MVDEAGCGAVRRRHWAGALARARFSSPSASVTTAGCSVTLGDGSARRPWSAGRHQPAGGRRRPTWPRVSTTRPTGSAMGERKGVLVDARVTVLLKAKPRPAPSRPNQGRQSTRVRRRRDGIWPSPAKSQGGVEPGQPAPGMKTSAHVEVSEESAVGPAGPSTRVSAVGSWTGSRGRRAAGRVRQDQHGRPGAVAARANAADNDVIRESGRRVQAGRCRATSRWTAWLVRRGSRRPRAVAFVENDISLDQARTSGPRDRCGVAGVSSTGRRLWGSVAGGIGEGALGILLGEEVEPGLMLVMSATHVDGDVSSRRRLGELTRAVVVKGSAAS